MIRALVVDDHPMFRQGVASVLEASAEIEVVGQAGSTREARTLIKQVRPDIVLIDIRLPDGDGVDLCAELRETSIKVVVLSQFSADRIVLRAFLRGAHGYVVKESEPEVLRQAVRAVMGGATFVDPRVAAKVVAAATKGPRAKGPYGLTPQELRVVELLPKRFSNREIARQLGLSEETVKTHLRHALRKLQVEDRTSAAAMVVEAGLA